MNNQQAKEEIKRSRKYYQTNENITLPKLWKAVLRGKFLAIDAYILKSRKISNKNNTKIHVEPQRTLNSQNNLEKEE